MCRAKFLAFVEKKNVYLHLTLLASTGQQMFFNPVSHNDDFRKKILSVLLSIHSMDCHMKR